MTEYEKFLQELKHLFLWKINRESGYYFVHGMRIHEM